MAQGAARDNGAAPAPPAVDEDPFRRDLADAFGIVLSPPWHGPDVRGNVSYGIRPPHGWTDPTLSSEFAATMAEIIRERASSLVDRGLLPPDAASGIEGRPYAIPPAAQSWAMFIYNLYLDARPFLNDGASLIAWGMFFRDVLGAAKGWVDDRRQSVNWESIPPGRRPTWISPQS